MSSSTAAGYDTFEIPVQRVAELQERIAKLNKKADKLGTPHIDLIVTDQTREIVMSVGGTMSLRMGTKFSYTVRTVYLRGETPKINGWEFLSVVMHRPAGNEFINVTDTAADLSSFVYTDKHCDHCLKNRVRNATFLVRHDDGQIKQVGSTCLTDYTGVKSPQAHAKQMENIYNLFRELRGGWGSTAGRTTKKFFLSEWVAFVNMQIREDGRYMSRNYVYDNGGITTGEAAKATIIAASENPNAKVPTDADYDAADKCIEWVRSDEGRKVCEDMGDYGINLLAACKSDDGDAVAENVMNIIAPLPAIYARAEAKKAQEAVQTTQEYNGQIKDRLLLSLTITKLSREIAGDYGAFAYVTMQDAQGRWYKASMNCKVTRNLTVGQTIALTGTVTKQAVDTFTGNKTTTLNRCKVS